MAGDWSIAGISVPPGTRARASIELTELPDGSRVKLPVALIHGARPGPTFYLGAAIHGDEANGVAIVTRVLASVNATALSGRVVCVPVQNPLAFQVDHRVPVGLYLKTPLDQAPMDPWTTFPGDPAGTITERLSHALFSLIRGCDAAIDVHTPTRGGRSTERASFSTAPSTTTRGDRNGDGSPGSHAPTLGAPCAPRKSRSRSMTGGSRPWHAWAGSSSWCRRWRSSRSGPGSSEPSSPATPDGAGSSGASRTRRFVASRAERSG